MVPCDNCITYAICKHKTVLTCEILYKKFDHLFLLDAVKYFEYKKLIHETTLTKVKELWGSTSCTYFPIGNGSYRDYHSL